MNNFPVFENLNLSIRKGKATALVGPNGCGKTTLLKSLLGKTKNSEIVFNSINELFDKKVSNIKIEDFKEYLRDKRNLEISIINLNYILSNYTNQGIIEFYPEVTNSIILNNRLYNVLRNRIPTIVSEQGGLLSLKQLKNLLKNQSDISKIISENEENFNEFIKNLDKSYQNFNISIANRDQRIFPYLLKNEFDFPPEIEDILPEENEKSF